VTRDRFRLRICRGCGCNDNRACPGGCAWVLLDIDTPSGICSTCAADMEWRPDVMGSAVCDAALDVLEPAPQRMVAR
jgi:hypothetical protein